MERPVPRHRADVAGAPAAPHRGEGRTGSAIAELSCTKAEGGPGAVPLLCILSIKGAIWTAAASFDHLVGERQQLIRKCQAKRLCGLEDILMVHRHIGRLLPF